MNTNCNIQWKDRYQALYPGEEYLDNKGCFAILRLSKGLNLNVAMPKAHIYTVGQITRYIKRLVEKDDALQNIWVKGEISNFKFPSRHFYFALKDEEALISCIMFQDRVNSLKFTLENGLEVMARGSIGVYKPQGRYQFYVEEILPVGKGALYLKFEQLKEELKQKGYFDPAHKIPLPYLPQRIGVVTSAKGAAIRDILSVLERRFSNIEVILAPCRVQGDEAAAEIAKAIQELNDYGRIDVMIVGRGGGSFEDLFAFNERIVAEAIYDSRIPVISAVGHEIDFTISDFVADHRSPTPSAAAELVVPRKKDLLELLENAKKRTSQLINNYLGISHSNLQRIRNSFPFKQPYRPIDDLKQGIDELEKGIISYLIQKGKLEKNRFLNLSLNFKRTSPGKKLELMKEELRRNTEKLVTLGQAKREKEREKLFFWKNRLEDLSPLSVLKRGYSICFSHPKGEIITEYKQVKEKEKIRVKLHKGKIYSEIYQIETN